MAKKAEGGDGVAKVLNLIKENGVEYVDLRFTDPRGKWQHTAQYISTVDEDALKNGFMFDGSSIAGWKAINESDMILLPDLDSAVLDPFSAKPSLILFCDIIEPATGQGYARDPRSTAKKAEAYLKSTGIGDNAFIGAEAEFFVFDNVKFGTGGNYGIYQLELHRGPGLQPEGLSRGQYGPPPCRQGRLLPRAAGGQRERPARRDALRHGRDGPADREASP